MLGCRESLFYEAATSYYRIHARQFKQPSPVCHPATKAAPDSERIVAYPPEGQSVGCPLCNHCLGGISHQPPFHTRQRLTGGWCTGGFSSKRSFSPETSWTGQAFNGQPIPRYGLLKLSSDRPAYPPSLLFPPTCIIPFSMLWVWSVLHMTPLFKMAQTLKEKRWGLCPR